PYTKRNVRITDENMKKVFMCLAATALLSSCGVTKSPVMGLAYTDVVSGNAVTSNQLASKVGKSTATGILGLVATGDASYQTAAKSAGITKISHGDERSYTILGIYTTYETIVYGE
ncbi:MAG: TRL-like family protein, partial [Tannerellaceae bacterium]|nr:TRL-like family protein [Tannerellaceae bacterium]